MTDVLSEAYRRGKHDAEQLMGKLIRERDDQIADLRRQLDSAMQMLNRNQAERDSLLDRLKDSNEWKHEYLRRHRELKEKLRELGRE